MSTPQVPRDQDRPAWPWPSVGWIASGSTAATVGIMVMLLEPASFTRTWAVVLASFGVFALARSLIQAGNGYVTPRPAKKHADLAKRTLARQLNALLGATLILVLAWIGGAAALFAYPNAPVLCKFGPTLALCALFIVSVLATLDRALEAGLARGTEIVSESKTGKRLFKMGRSGQAFLPVKWLLDWLDNPTPPDLPSALALSLAAVLMIAPVAELEAHAARTFKQRAKEAFSAPVEGAGLDTDRADAEPAGTSTREGTLRASRADAPAPAAGPVPDEPNRECPSGIWPGEGAPAPQRDDLAALWLGRPGVPGYGYGEAGCPSSLARAVTERRDVWSQVGECAGTLRSVGVAAAGRPPALLLQQAGEFARVEAQEARLRGGWARTDIGRGDFYIVDSEPTPAVLGSFVLIRRQKATGTIERRVGSGRCRELTDVNVPYTVVAPGMLSHWRRVVERHGWVWPDDGGRAWPAGRRIAFRNEANEALAWGTCSTVTSCSLELDGRTYSNDRYLVTTPDEILALRP